MDAMTDTLQVHAVARADRCIPTDQILLLLLAALSAVLYLPNLGNRDLWNPNEPGYALVAREMVESGNYLYPTTAGRPRGEKPAPYYWLIVASSYLAGGVNEAAARIPSATFGLALVMLTFLIARSVTDSTGAALSAIALAVSFRFCWQARWAEPDMVLAFFDTASLAMFHRGIRDEAHRTSWYLSAYAAAGVACLIKGPVGLAIPAVAIVSYCVALRSPSRIWSFKPVWGLLIVVAIAAPWYVAASLSGGRDFAYDLIVRQNFLRFVLPFDHREPPYFFLLVIFADFAPFSIFIPGAIAHAIRHRRVATNASLTFFLSWLIGGLIFLSLSASKREAYLLPLYPAAAILVGSMLSAWIRREPIPRWYTEAPSLLWCAILSMVGVAGIAFMLAAERFFPRSIAALQNVDVSLSDARSLALPFIVIALAAAVAGAFALAARKRTAVVLSIAGTMALVLMLLQQRVLPALNPYKSAKSASTLAALLAGSNGRLVGYSPVPDIRWSDNFYLWDAYLFYSHRKIAIIDDPLSLSRIYRSASPTVVIIRERDFDSLPGTTTSAARIAKRFRVGHREMLLTINAALSAEPVPLAGHLGADEGHR